MFFYTDIEELKLLCEQKSFDGMYPIIQPVIVSNCILVQGFIEKTKECDLEYYFDTKRKSGVEGVTSIKMNKEAGYCIICFENTEGNYIYCLRPSKHYFVKYFRNTIGKVLNCQFYAV